MSKLEDAEIEDLFRRLDVTQDWTIGFLSGVLSGPDAIDESAWLPFVLANQVSEANMKTVRKIRDAVSLSLHTDVRDVCPEPNDVEGIAEFCGGFLRGARMHAIWRSERTPELVAIGALAGEEDVKIDASVHRKRLAEYIAALRARFRKGPASASKVARNDPCPCGSGKKYKKCCGA